MAKRLFLIDGTALAYRSFFAFQGTGRSPLTTEDGHPTAATYGFCMTLRALIEREQPDAMAIAFDGPRSDLLRTKIYPEYKSTRTKMPDEMAVQLDDIQEAVDGFGLRKVSAEEHEADDVIGTLAVRGRAAGMEVFIVTGDKDFLQIVDDKIKLWNLRSSTSKPEIFDADLCQEKWGLPPTAIVDMLALMGDSSDNVPGVPKVGKKTAVELLTTYGSIDRIYENLEEVKKPSIKKSLDENRELASLSKQLVTLQLDLPLDVSVESLEAANPDPDKLRPLFQRLQFKNLLADLATRGAPQPDIEQHYSAITGADELRALVARLSKLDSVAVAAETVPSGLHDHKVCGIALAEAPGVATYVPLPDEVAAGHLEILGELLAAETPKKHVHDLKRLLAALRGASIELRGVDLDTMLASYCTEPGLRAHSLDELALKHFAFKKTSQKDLIGSGKKQRTFAEIDPALVGNYVSEEADLVIRLVPILRELLDRYETASLYRDIELPLVPVLLRMEQAGINIDRDQLTKLSAEMHDRIEVLAERVFERAGHEFNLASPQQLGVVLFDELEVHRLANVKPKRTPKGQYKTDHDVLTKLAAKHEVPQLVLEWRQLTKLKSTYIDSLPNSVDLVTGRVHTHYGQAQTATGRLSSNDPNLQNIPVRSPKGREIRKAFVPRKGWKLLAADYSQIELRILAALTGDIGLLTAFKEGQDIHTATAAKIFDVVPGEVTRDQRSTAKMVNFGIPYGISAFGLAQRLGTVSRTEAQEIIDSYFAQFPGIPGYMEAQKESAKENGYVETRCGRRRHLRDINSGNGTIRAAAERNAINMPIQGTAADMIKIAMVRIQKSITEKGLKSRMLLQVHDELIFDMEPSEEAELHELVSQGMIGALELPCPIEIEIGLGENWLEAH